MSPFLTLLTKSLSISSIQCNASSAGSDELRYLALGDYDKKIVGLAGVKSGRDMDKIKELGLTLEEPETISVPGIKEFPLTLECRVVYKQQQKSEMLLPEYNEKFYPQDVDGLFHGANKDYHVMYFGEIVDAYIIK